MIHREVLNTILMETGGTTALDDAAIRAFSDRVEIFMCNLITRCCPDLLAISGQGDQDISEEALMRDLDLPAIDSSGPRVEIACRDVLEAIKS